MITMMLKSLFDAVAKGFSYGETKVNKQCETEVLKNKKHSEKTSEKQEDLLVDMMKLLLKYQPMMSKADRIRVNVYSKRIKGVN